MQEKKVQQELERQKEEDELKRRNKKPKQGPVKEEPPMKKSQIPSRQVATLTHPVAKGRHRVVHHCNWPVSPAHFPSRKLTQDCVDVVVVQKVGGEGPTFVDH